MTIQPNLIGHYAGSLRNRLKFQDNHEQFLLLADMHALTDNAHDIGKVRGHVIEVALDWLAVGSIPDAARSACNRSFRAAVSATRPSSGGLKTSCKP